MKRPFLLLLTTTLLAAAPAPTPFTPDHWSQLLTQLASPNFKDREAATNELNALAPDDIPTLQQQVITATDPEVIARLTARLKELQGPQLVITAQAPPIVRFADSPAIQVTLTNKYPSTLTFPAGTIQVHAATCLSDGHGNVFDSDIVTLKTSSDPNAPIVIPGNGSLPCQVIIPTAACLNLQKNSVVIVTSAGGVTQSNPFSLPPSPLLFFTIQPSTLMNDIWSAKTPAERAKVQTTLNDLLKEFTQPTVNDKGQIFASMTPYTAPYLLPYVVQAAQYKDPDIRTAAITWALPETADSISPYNDWLAIKPDEPSPPLWKQALVPGNPDATMKSARALEAAALTDSAPAVRIAAIGCYRNQPNFDDLPTIQPLTKDPDPLVRQNALSFMSRFADHPEAASMLTSALADPDSATRDRALTLLETSPAAPPINVLAEAFASARGPAAIRLLATLTEHETPNLPKLLAPNFSARTLLERLAILSALAGHDDSITLQLITESLQDKDPTLQRIALQRLLIFPAKIAQPLLEKHRASAPPDLQSLNDSVAREINQHNIFPAAPAEILLPAKDAYFPRVSPDGQWIAYSQLKSSPFARLGHQNNHIATHIAKPDGTEDHIISDGILLQWLADSKHVVTINVDSVSISDLDANITDEFGTPKSEFPYKFPNNTWITSQSPMPHFKTIDHERTQQGIVSPDGKWFGPFSMLSFISIDGTLKNIPLRAEEVNSAKSGRPIWSPDGKLVACWSQEGLNVFDFTNLCTLAIALPIEQQIPNVLNGRIPRWNPWSSDSSNLTFVRNGQIFTANPDGSHAQQLTFDAAQKTSPTFSPDGTKIAYLTFQRNARTDYSFLSSDLWVLDLKTSLALRLTAPNASPINCLDWLNNQTIIFDRPSPTTINGGTLQTISLHPLPPDH